MSPIEEYLINCMTRDLAARGLPDAQVAVCSADAENWRFRVTSQGLEFEIGFNHRDQLWARETTPGREKHLVSNDHPGIPTSAEARTRAIMLVASAIADPQFPPRDPPVI